MVMLTGAARMKVGTKTDTLAIFCVHLRAELRRVDDYAYEDGG
jgi:hypothetical protein